MARKQQQGASEMAPIKEAVDMALKSIVRDYFSERPEAGLSFEGVQSRAKQEFKDECDVNNIMRKYANTGLLAHVTASTARYGDFSNVKDYQSALNAVIDAEAAFMTLPAKLRDRFQNDPQQLIEFLERKENKAEAEELGLVKSVSSEAGSESGSGSPPRQPAASTSEGKSDAGGKNGAKA